MNKMDLGKLSKIELREAWKHEALDFTNWLALEENLSLLSDEIGIDIKLLQTEASVGSFNVDILAEEENTGRKEKSLFKYPSVLLLRMLISSFTNSRISKVICP